MISSPSESQNFLVAANDGVPDGDVTPSLAATYNKMLIRTATVVQVLHELI